MLGELPALYYAVTTADARRAAIRWVANLIPL